jgi:DNA-binding MarR family transcriptional regulator
MGSADWVGGREAIAEQLGERSYRVYRELIRFVDLNGYVPSYAELGGAVGCAPSTVGRHLDKLQTAGLIQRRDGRARAIVIKVAS